MPGTSGRHTDRTETATIATSNRPTISSCHGRVTLLCDGSYAGCACVVLRRTPPVLLTGRTVQCLEEEVRASGGGALELLHHAAGIVQARGP